MEHLFRWELSSTLGNQNEKECCALFIVSLPMISLLLGKIESEPVPIVGAI